LRNSLSGVTIAAGIPVGGMRAWPSDSDSDADTDTDTYTDTDTDWGVRPSHLGSG